MMQPTAADYWLNVLIILMVTLMVLGLAGAIFIAGHFIEKFW